MDDVVKVVGRAVPSSYSYHWHWYCYPSQLYLLPTKWNEQYANANDILFITWLMANVSDKWALRVLSPIHKTHLPINVLTANVNLYSLGPGVVGAMVGEVYHFAVCCRVFFEFSFGWRKLAQSLLQYRAPCAMPCVFASTTNMRAYWATKTGCRLSQPDFQLLQKPLRN